MDATILWLILLLLLSGFFSSSELAFVVSNKIKLELRARKNNLAAKNAVFYIQKITQKISCVLLYLTNIEASQEEAQGFLRALVTQFASSKVS